MSPAKTSCDLSPPHARGLARWLFLLAGMVFIMIAIGGLTRLTESGLSITEWKPIAGTLPPLSEAEWQDLFARYQQTPEYQHVNEGFGLEGFKKIFWLEYIHRLWGRLIGIMLIIPGLYFLWRGDLRGPLLRHAITLFILGGLQGALGWYMVASGLVDRPDVSHYRLAAHLMAALFLYVYLLWLGLSLWRHAASPAHYLPPSPRLKIFTRLAAAWLALTLFYGALVAGLDAGKIYNTYPSMGGAFLPAEWADFQPFWRNALENPALVQWLHRWLAAGLAVFLILGGIGLASKAPAYAKLLYGIALLAAIQFLLGLATLLSGVPLIPALGHQMNAVLLLTLLVILAHQLWGKFSP